ncbi:hypothetical protein M427DRAFT_57217 [Gonapodya prolifera JEL478]|uniref:PB1 domain-containing protein n=1 Tax=Gonapodya prolifera (strain JEL478) TaxID=1344416 RepID=A0A139AEF9_GONPJ|nr:hypothetical protein M427DRAFT_57217 [Gonapodya prolifera JEL478]|eukprot:KXS14813.1 hypothetical protein M427DRAFT_57217 [Gonapodya prolifera JEL478]
MSRDLLLRLEFVGGHAPVAIRLRHRRMFTGVDSLRKMLESRIPSALKATNFRFVFVAEDGTFRELKEDEDVCEILNQAREVITVKALPQPNESPTDSGTDQTGRPPRPSSHAPHSPVPSGTSTTIPRQTPNPTGRRPSTSPSISPSAPTSSYPITESFRSLPRSITSIEIVPVPVAAEPYDWDVPIRSASLDRSVSRRVRENLLATGLTQAQGTVNRRSVSLKLIRSVDCVQGVGGGGSEEGGGGGADALGATDVADDLAVAVETSHTVSPGPGLSTNSHSAMATSRTRRPGSGFWDHLKRRLIRRSNSFPVSS